MQRISFFANALHRFGFKTVLLTALFSLFAAAPLCFAAEAPTKEKPIVWRMGGLYARGVSYGKTYQGFADNVKRLSGGRMIIEVVYDGEGVPASEQLSAVRSGLLEMSNPFQALHAGEFPAGVVELGLPDGPSNLLELRAMFREGEWLETMRKAYASIGVYYLTEAGCASGTYLLTKKPIKSVADLKELKIRCPGAYGMKLANLGASPVTMALSEVYSSLASGLLDGVDGCTMLDHYEAKTFEMAKYFYPQPVSNAQILGLICNLEAWNKLPDDLKAIMQAAGELYANDWANKSVVWEREAYLKMKAAGLQDGPAPSDADVKTWQAAGRKVWVDYAAKDSFCKQLLDLQTKFMKQLGYSF